MAGSWTPTEIGRLAGAIEGHAQTIDTMLWHVQQYKVRDDKRGDFADELTYRLELLKKAIDEFKALDCDRLILDLEKSLPAFRGGIL